MAYAGDIIAIATVQFFGSVSDGDTATYKLFIDGSTMTNISYTGQGLAGLQTMSGSKSVSSGTRSIQVTVSSISGIVSPSADCQITVFRRYR